MRQHWTDHSVLFSNAPGQHIANALQCMDLQGNRAESLRGIPQDSYFAACPNEIFLQVVKLLV